MDLNNFTFAQLKLNTNLGKNQRSVLLNKKNKYKNINIAYSFRNYIKDF